MPAGQPDQLPLGARAGQLRHRVQPGRDPGHAPAAAVQLGGEPVAAPPVGQPDPADLAVVAAGADELGQGELVQRGRARDQLRGHGVQQPRRDDEPAEAQRRGQALARGAGVDDAIGGQRLQRADRLPVIPELPVVVIFDDHPAPPRRGPAAPRVQGDAERELVGRGQQRGVRPGRRAGQRAVGVDGQDLQAQAAGRDQVAVGLVASTVRS